MVILSFDIEEFDLPLEYGVNLPEEDQIRVSERGLNNLLDMLEEEKAPATFYSTFHFMESLSPETHKRLTGNGSYEIASHGMRHGSLSEGDLSASKRALEDITGKEVTGFRMPRMMPADIAELARAGYDYDSSLNPTIIPGRYNNLSKPSTPYIEHNGLVRLPGPVTPRLRIPLFWLGLHHYSLWLYRSLCHLTHAQTDYLQLYFHPWEFEDWTKEKGLEGIPYLVKHNVGTPMLLRLRSVIRSFREKQADFGTATEAAHRAFEKDKSIVS